MSASHPFPLRSLMDWLVGVEEAVHPDLVVYRYRPHNAPQLDTGAIYNWFAPTPHTQQAVDRERDTLNVLARVGIAHSDSSDEMAAIETYAQAFIDVVDPTLKRVRPAGHDTIKRAWRDSFRMLTDDFSGIAVLCIEFPLVFEIDRMVLANT